MIKGVISDADGTLVDTLYLIRHGQYEAAAQYLVDRGIPRHDLPTYETYEEFINESVGGSTRETFEKTIRMLFEEAQAHHLDRINFDELDERLAPVQDRIAPIYVRPFNGLADLLTWLGNNGINFGIFTSGDRRMIVRNFGISLPELGLSELYMRDDAPVDDRFKTFIAKAESMYGIPEISVVTCNDVNQTKPSPEGINKLMSNLELAEDEVIVLGDHLVDVKAAKKAGVHCVGVSHGFRTKDELLEAGAIHVIDDLTELPGLIEQHNSGEHTLF